MTKYEKLSLFLLMNIAQGIVFLNTDRTLFSDEQRLRFEEQLLDLTTNVRGGVEAVLDAIKEE